MTDNEIIAYQAKRIVDLEQNVKILQEQKDKALMHIYCIGGPLNDNNLKFTKEQQYVFWNIAKELRN